MGPRLLRSRSLKLSYWGTGNPSPDYNGNERMGDNLYTCSMLAIDPETGKMKWYFQFSPHEVHDWDSVEIPVLFNATIDGKPTKAFSSSQSQWFLLCPGPRDRQIHHRACPFAEQTWAKGLDENGRPIHVNNGPTPEGNLLYPAVTGATNWGVHRTIPTGNSFL